MNYPNKKSELIDFAQQFSVEDVCWGILDDKKFYEWSACVHHTGHHYGTGGLQYHTWEVISLCLANADFFIAQGKIIDKKVLFLAALYHDVGKIWDYQEVEVRDDYGICRGQAWVGTPHKRTIHHISRSAIEWSTTARFWSLSPKLEEDVLHCILSHHGQREWGSPVAPKSREAWLLHLCDGLSARAADCDTIDLIHVK